MTRQLLAFTRPGSALVFPCMVRTGWEPNSLLEAVVFGRRAGRAIRTAMPDLAPSRIDEGDLQRAIAEVDRLLKGDGPERAGAIRQELREVMMIDCGVFRTEPQLKNCLSTLKSLQERYQRISIDDKGWQFNTDLVEAIELGHMPGVRRGDHYRGPRA